MSSSKSFRRKKYGMVKPVKQPKTKIVAPKVRELRSILNAFSKTSTAKSIDYLAYAVAWCQRAMPYVSQEHGMDNAEQLRAFTDFSISVSAGKRAKDNDAKRNLFVNALTAFRQWARGVLTIPELKIYLVKQAAYDKALRVKTKQLAGRYSKLTDILYAALQTDFDFEVVPVLEDNSDKVYIHHDLKKISIAKEYADILLRMQKTLGIMQMLLLFAAFPARAMAMDGDGYFAVDYKKTLINYHLMLARACEWASDNRVRNFVKLKKRTKQILNTTALKAQARTGK